MTPLFTSILNMSITASFVALAVMLIRLLFKETPKAFSYILWLAVLLRLVLPFSFHSSYSFLNLLQPHAETDTGAMTYISYHTGVKSEAGTGTVNGAAASLLPVANPVKAGNFAERVLEGSAIIWIIGMISLLFLFLISYLKINHKVRTATRIRDNIYETDRITTPFVFGLFRPRIYVPVGLSEQESSYVIAHEQTHIDRLDYLIKPVAYLVLIVHWFNPLMWLTFAMMSKDMEMSCDERVIKTMGDEAKRGYSTSLLSLSVRNSGLLVGMPLAFGKHHIHSRINNVLRYKRPTSKVVILASVLTLIVITGCTFNPAVKQHLSADRMDELADTWAYSLMTRDGKPRYEIMSAEMKKKFEQEQIIRSGEDWNFNIGVSSPWVVSYDISIDNQTATITYLTRTSVPASYQTEEVIHFADDDGKIVVDDYHYVYEDKLIEE